jgi:hypothetical protein
MPTTVTIPINKPKPVSVERKRSFNPLKTAIARLQAKRYFSKIKKALKEVDQTRQGEKQPKSLAQFLKEI